jgi:hypothetical protein
MLLVESYVDDSPIAGLGLFVDEAVPKGTVAAIFTRGLSLIREDEYNERTLAGDLTVIKTACRFVDRIFLCRESGELEDEDFVNHSFTPNLLYHCGICFTLRDLVPGEELTVNYQYLLSADEPGFHDVKTGRYVSGLSPQKALYRSSKQLQTLMRDSLAETGAEILRHPGARRAFAPRMAP